MAAMAEFERTQTKRAIQLILRNHKENIRFPIHNDINIIFISLICCSIYLNHYPDILKSYVEKAYLYSSIHRPCNIVE